MNIDEVVLEDCRNYIKKVSDNFIDLIIIDPPYNELPKDWDDFKDWGYLKNEFNRVLKENGQLYIFGKQPMLSEVYYEIKDKFEFRFELIWNKNKGLWSSNYLPMRSHELIWCFKKKGVKTTSLYFNINAIKTPGAPYIRKNKVKSTVRHNWKENHTIVKDGLRYPLSVINHPPVSSKSKLEGTTHPTQKPVEILKWIIKSSSKQGDIVLDCFMGSGSTAISCIQLNRHFIGCEIKEEFYRICNKRIKEELENNKSIYINLLSPSFVSDEESSSL